MIIRILLELELIAFISFTIYWHKNEPEFKLWGSMLAGVIYSLMIMLPISLIVAALYYFNLLLQFIK